MLHMKLKLIFSKFVHFAYSNTLALLVFLLPIQTRLVFFTENSKIGSSYIFYNTLFIYLTDLVAVILIVLFLGKLLFNKFKINDNLLFISSLTLFGLITLFSLFVSYETKEIYVYFEIFKLFIILMVFCFISNVKLVKQQFHKLFYLILAISVIVSLLGLFQYYNQSSLGLNFVGEEYLRNYMSGVARFQMPFGELTVFDRIFNVYRETFVMRPYGTFSHPNVFGAFMAFSAILSYYLYLVSHGTLRKLVVIGIFLSVMTLFTSFSRVSIVSWGIATFVFYLSAYLFVVKHNRYHLSIDSHETRKKLVNLAKIVCFCVFFSVFLYFPQLLDRGFIVSYGTTNIEAINDRILYQNIALEMVKQHPLTGVGYKNFVLAMDSYTDKVLAPHQYQPVHNIYLLIAAESGLVVLGLFFFIIGAVIFYAFFDGLDILKITLMSLLVMFLFIGFFDHYLWTIQQGRLMLFLTLGFLAAYRLEKIVSRETGLSKAV